RRSVRHQIRPSAEQQASRAPQRHRTLPGHASNDAMMPEPKSAKKDRLMASSNSNKWPAAVTLTGMHASLVPLAAEHEAALAEAARDGELWKLWYTSVPHADRMAAEIERRLALQVQGTMLPFTVLDADGGVAGMTT